MEFRIRGGGGGSYIDFELRNLKRHTLEFMYINHMDIRYDLYIYIYGIG